MLTDAEADEAERRAGPAPDPPLGTWPRMYALVMGWALVLITLFALFQSAYA